MRARWARAAVLAALAVSVTLGAAACSSTPQAAPSSSAASFTGAKGAADFSAGYLRFGNGKTDVATYIDPMCPYCGEFENANGRELATLVNNGGITLRVHPLNFLDRSSQGTDYSTRAANALTCVAVDHPSQALRFLGALYSQQPREGSAGLTDAQLTTMAENSGAPGMGECIDKRTYAPWIDELTNTALNGPIKGADITKIQGTPTVLVNGRSYQGDITDTAALRKFISAGGR